MKKKLETMCNIYILNLVNFTRLMTKVPFKKVNIYSRENICNDFLKRREEIGDCFKEGLTGLVLHCNISEKQFEKLSIPFKESAEVFIEWCEENSKDLESVWGNKLSYNLACIKWVVKQDLKLLKHCELWGKL